ncbi:MAG: response regulator [Deltaproteobacteria bacterium]|nr:response regulator [Deltaproteobacteria bacterium]
MSLFPLWGVEFVTNLLLVVLSLYAVRMSRNITRARPYVSLWMYLHWQVIAFAVFAISHSVGHIVKRLLLLGGQPAIWDRISPFTGAVNSIAFVVVSILTFLYKDMKLASERFQDLEDAQAGLQARTADLYKAKTTLEQEVAERQRAERGREALLAREQAARAEAEHVGRMKDAFLATLSHELRTPLSAILGWAQLLLRAEHRTALDSRRALETILRNARAQARLIDDLLDVSSIVSGRFLIQRQPVDLGAVTRAAVESARPAANARSIVLEERGEHDHALVMGDPIRLQQIIWNLLSNGIKFTPTGGRVRVSLRRVQSQLEIVVDDTGPGIPAGFEQHLFERFQQANPSTTRSQGGLGLGLAIVRHLTELHGGTVQARNRTDSQGAAFTVSLPATTVPYSEPAVPSERFSARGAHCTSLAGIRVLVVDDEPDARELFEQVLKESQAEVECARSAAEAMSCLGRHRPSVLVSDIAMPEEDGYALIRRVRALPREQGGDVPALALTAFARSEERARALAAGFQTHLSKPVDLRDLVIQVRALADRHPAQA